MGLDDADFLVKAQSSGQDGQTNDIDNRNLRLLVAYLPQCSNGSFPYESAARKLFEERDIIAIKLMGRLDALAREEASAVEH